MAELTLKEWLGTDDEACADIVRKKYLISKDILGHEETVDEFLDRVSIGNERIRQLIKERKFIPGGRILAGVGLDKYGIKASLSNCYVMKPPKDNIKSIYKTCGDEGITYSRGGGCGTDISNLAPKGARVNNTAKESSGAVSFMDTFSQVATQIGQNGRRGAALLSIKDTHPDLEDFITYKRDLNKVNSANLSIMVSDAFMDAVKKDEDWTLFFDRQETDEYIEKTVKARYIMRLIAETNWEMGEPGMLFWDTFEKNNIMSADPTFKYAGVNPCGEEPLPAGGACLLGSMNVSSYYNYAVDIFDSMSFEQDVRVAIEYLDTIVDIGMDLHPLKYQRKSARDYRQIGLGVMGLADLFIKKKYVYGNSSSINLVNIIGRIMSFEALRTSCNLAMEKGAFPKCDNAAILNSNYIDNVIRTNIAYSQDQKDELLQDIAIYGLRNSALLTCAPTGTTSTIFNVSNGIEPLFSTEYERTTKTVYNEEKSYTVHPIVIQKWLNLNEYKSIHEAKEANDLPDFIVSARDIHWKQRLAVQSSLQYYIDASISSTINLPKNTTVEEIEQLYEYAFDMGCKGVTVFREGCSRTPILKDVTNKDNKVACECKVHENNTKSSNDRIYDLENPYPERKIEPKPLKEAKSVDVEFTCADLKDIIDKDKYNAIEKITHDQIFGISTKPRIDINKINELAYYNLKNCDDYIGKTSTSKILKTETVDCSSCIRCNNCEKLSKELAYLTTPIHVEPMFKVYADKSEKLKSEKPKMLTRKDFGEVLHGNTYYMKVACGHIYITINNYNGMPVEVFMRSSKSGGCAANTNALGRMASSMLRSSIPVEDIIDSVIGIKCDACVKLKGKGENISGLSCSDVMARALKMEYEKCLEYRKMKMYHKAKEDPNPDKDKIMINPDSIKYNYKDYSDQDNIDNGICPECGNKLSHTGGCVNCTSCGFSLCS